MENKNSLWNKFISTGKVQDYLAYSQKKEDLNEKGSKEIKEDTNKRNNTPLYVNTKTKQGNHFIFPTLPARPAHLLPRKAFFHHKNEPDCVRIPWRYKEPHPSP